MIIKLEPVRNIVEARAADAPRLHDSFFAFGNTVELKDNVWSAPGPPGY